MEDSAFSNFNAVEFVLAAVLAVAAAVPAAGRPRRLAPVVRLPAPNDAGGGVTAGGAIRGVAGAGAGAGVAAGFTRGVDAGAVPSAAGAGAGATAGNAGMRGAAFDEEPTRTSPGGKGLAGSWAIEKLVAIAHKVQREMRLFLNVIRVILFRKWVALICYFESPRI